MRLFLPLALGVLLTLGCGKNSPPDGDDRGKTTDSSKGGNRKPEVMATPITAEEIGKDFKTDKQAAEQKHKDKVYLIDAIVDDATGVAGPKVVNSTLILVGYVPPGARGLDVVNLMCFLTPEASRKCLHLSKGQKVKVRGKCADTFSFLVRFVECDLIEAGPDTALAVTAEQLVKEFMDDRDAAEKKYKDRQVIVAGEVIDLRESQTADMLTTHYKMFLKGADSKEGKPVPVEVYMEKEDFGRVKKGQQVKVKSTSEVSYLDFSKEVVLSALRLVE
jgi:hypothetical protein